MKSLQAMVEGRKLIWTIERLLSRVDYNLPQSFYDSYDRIINRGKWDNELVMELTILARQLRDYLN